MDLLAYIYRIYVKQGEGNVCMTRVDITWMIVTIPIENANEPLLMCVCMSTFQYNTHTHTQHELLNPGGCHRLQVTGQRL